MNWKKNREIILNKQNVTERSINKNWVWRAVSDLAGLSLECITKKSEEFLVKDSDSNTSTSNVEVECVFCNIFIFEDVRGEIFLYIRNVLIVKRQRMHM